MSTTYTASTIRPCGPAPTTVEVVWMDRTEDTLRFATEPAARAATAFLSDYYGQGRELAMLAVV